jgi:hypothetical protein
MKNIRYNALLVFPDKALKDEVIMKIKDDGYTCVAANVSAIRRDNVGQGFSLKQFYELAKLCDKYGLSIRAFTGYQKYNEPLLRQYPHRKMVCNTGNVSGEVYKAKNWLCPFQPENKSFYVEFLTKILEIKTVTEIFLNDEAFIGACFSEDSIACYCDFCKNDFFSITGQYPPIKVNEDKVLWDKWIAYRLKSWNEVHKYFRNIIKEKRPDIRVGIQYSPIVVANKVNPYVLGIDLPEDARNLDIICTDPYHKNQTFMYSYKPCGRYLTESARMLKGATTDCELEIYPQAFCPPFQSHEVTYVDGILAGTIPFALGASAITPYNYQLMQVIPDFPEALKESMNLKSYFEKNDPYAYVSVINPQETHIQCYQDGDWAKNYLERWHGIMNQVGLPWEWVFDGCIEDKQKQWDTKVIILPETLILSKEQLQVIQELKQKGVGILWVGQSPFIKAEKWNESSQIIFEATQNKLGFNFEHTMVVMDFASFKPAISGDVIFKYKDKPIVIVNDTDGGREAWVSGIPVYNYVRPDFHGSVRTQTGGINLLKSLLKWLSITKPVACLDPWPPPNAYNNLRPWDRRDVPTMELFPMSSPNSVFCLLVNYIALAYKTNLIINIPENKTIKSFINVVTKENLIPKSNIVNGTITLPIYMDDRKHYLAVELIYE